MNIPSTIAFKVMKIKKYKNKENKEKRVEMKTRKAKPHVKKEK